MTDWHVLGAGALGCLWAANLYKSGHGVELLLKDQQGLAEFRLVDGITLVKQEIEELLPVTASVVETGATALSHLLITTKAHQTMNALDKVISRMSAECILLLVQNGMGVAEQIQNRLPDHRLFCGVTTDGAYCPEPYTVVYAGAGNTYIGSIGNQADPAPLLDKLPVEYMEIKCCDDIVDRQWQKLAVNCAINGLTVIFHCRNGELLNIPKAKLRLRKLCNEIALVGKAIGYHEWEQSLYSNTESVIRLTAANYSSMYQDIENRRRTEIDYINGYLLKQAEELGIACPENEKLYEEIKEKEMLLGCT